MKEENGILVSAGNIEELAKAIIQLVSKTDVEIMGQVNRNKAIEMFSFYRVINDNITVYENI